MRVPHRRTLGVLHEMLKLGKQVLRLVTQDQRLLIFRLLKHRGQTRHTLGEGVLLFLFFPLLCPLTIGALVTHLQLFTALAGTRGDLLRLISLGRILFLLVIVVLEGDGAARV